MADPVIGAIKYALKMARTRRTGIAINGIQVTGQAPQDLSCICRVYFTNTQVIQVNVNSEIEGMLSGKTAGAEKFIESNPFVKNMMGAGVMELSWTQLKKTVQTPSSIDYSVKEMPDISNAQTFVIDYNSISKISLRKQSLIGKSDYLLEFHEGMLREYSLTVDPNSYDGIVELIKKTPLAPRLG